MKVSVLVHDVASNTLWAATAIARALQSQFDVEVVGPDLGHGICAMYRDEFPYKVVPARRLYRFPDFLWQVRRIERVVTGNVVIAVKGYMDTVPVALRKKQRGAKAIVYLDEWDSAGFRSLPAAERRALALRNLHHPLNESWFPLVERMIPLADRVVSSSAFLQRRFGGEVIPLGVDTNLFKPQPESDVQALRESLGLAGRRVIVFGGVVRPHKGMECLLEALRAPGLEDVRLLVVGPETDHLRGFWSDRVVCTGPKARAEMPRYLAVADLVVLPQEDSLLARSQVPCKVFEAMAMAKPIIASDVSDLPEILNGCGWIVAPGDPGALAAAIASVLSDPVEAPRRGEAARRKCIAEFGWRAVETRWADLVGRVAGGGKVDREPTEGHP